MRIIILLFLLPIHNLYADDKGFSLQGIVLEKSDFNDVFKALKVPKVEPLIRSSTDGSDHFICFTTKDNMVLEFNLFTYTKQGFTKYIEEITLYAPGHSAIRFSQGVCSRISLRGSDLKFKNKIGLNTKKQAIYDYLGNPMKKVKDNNSRRNGHRAFFIPNKFNKYKFGKKFYFPRNYRFQGMEAYYFFKKVEDNLGETLVVRVGYNEKNLVNMISAKKTTHGLPDDKDFSLQGIVLGRSDFDDVFKALKVPKVEPLNYRHRKDKHNAGKFICFTTKDNVFLEFWSGIMGMEEIITEISFYTPGHSAIRFSQGACSRISLRSSDLKFKNKIGFNTKKQAIYDYLGSPMKEMKKMKKDDLKLKESHHVVPLFSPKTPNKPEKKVYFNQSRVFQGIEAYDFRNAVRDNYSENLSISIGYDEKNFVNMISVSKTTTN